MQLALDAARRDDGPALKDLLAEHPSLANASDDAGTTLAKAAASEGSLSCLRIALSAGADPNANPLGSRTALMAAAATAREPCVEALLHAGANPNIVLPDTGTTALMMSARLGAALCLEHLLRAGARHSATDREGRSALRIAVDVGPKATAAVKVLLRHGADPEQEAADGLSAMEAARVRGDAGLFTAMERAVAAAARLQAAGGATLKAAIRSAQLEADLEGTSIDEAGLRARAADIMKEWEAARAGRKP
ncbi:hypothetical protein FNF27_02624 [Cafeteria roenbergensis]|nr:hypothetical protein FNF27_02624 [Cafeteria roenbergensis]